MMATIDGSVARRMVGRGDEIARLRRAAAEAVNGTGQCVFVGGESGIGKTRLLAELRTGFPGQIVQAQCYEEEQSHPLAPLQFGFQTIMSEQALGPYSDPAAAQRGLFEALAAELFEVADRQPLLIIFEDLHWSDESTLAFIRFLARRIAGQRVLLAGTYRPRDVPPTLADLLTTLERERTNPIGMGAGSLMLAPLSRKEVDAFLGDLLGTGPSRGAHGDVGSSRFPREFVDAVATLSEGNPLYVEEIVRAMIQAGDLYQSDGVWMLRMERRPGVELRVPANVQDAVRRQTAALSANAARVLGVAAVAGRKFEFGVLAEVTRLPEGELLAALKELIAAGLILEETDDKFAFRHPLLREAARAQLLGRERRHIHLKAAEALDRMDEGVGARQPSELAYHYFEAGAWERALEEARLAAEQAQRINATGEALRHFSRALQCAVHLALDPPLDLLFARADLYERAGEFEAAAADLEAARVQAERTGRPREAWRALLKQGYLWSSRDYRRSLEFLEAGLTVAESLDDASSQALARAQTLNRIGNVYLNRDEPAKALPHHRAALLAFETAADEAGQAETLELLGVCYYNLPDILAGAESEERALALGQRTGDHSVIFHASIHLLLPLRFETEVGPPVEPERLVRLGEQALATARTMEWAGGEAQALGLLGGFHGLVGRYDKALPYLLEAVKMADRLGYGVGVSAGERMMAAVLLELLAYDEAVARLRRGLAEADAAGAQLFADIAALALCQVLAVRRGPADLAEADQLLRGLLAEGRMGNGRIAREALCVRAELELGRGDAAAALATLEPLIAQTRNLEGHSLAAIPRLALLLGQALLSARRRDDAAVPLEAAIIGAAMLHRRPLSWRAHAAFGRLCLDGKQRLAAREHFAQARHLIEEEAASIPFEELRGNFLERARATLPTPHAPTERQRLAETHGGLTERERAVARLVAAGESNRGIGERLVISERTAERHVANILDKLGLGSRVQLATWAAEHLRLD